MPLTELDRPLGQDRVALPGRPWLRWIALAAAGIVLAAVLGIVLFVAVRRDPDGGEPIASAAIEKRAAAPSAPVTQPGLPPSPRSQSSASQLETESGVTVMRPGSEAPGSIVITVPDAVGPIRLSPAPDSRLVERTRLGILPRIGPDGATAAQIYARPLDPQPGTKPAGRVALLVGGLGISQSGTADAIAKLPGPVSLAFAPYGADLERAVQRSRGDGHEVFLQVPMEPFDYPDNDPGPHTLLAGPKAAENIERLHWLLGRFTGYVGIVNFLGGRLTADESALSPVLRELAGRGLMVVDDGSSSRSLLAASASRAQIPALRIDRVIDGVARGDAIDRELERLEALAREQGVAVAAASALPVTVERIARWAATLDAKGLQLVPVSAARTLREAGKNGSPR